MRKSNRKKNRQALVVVMMVLLVAGFVYLSTFGLSHFRDQDSKAKKQLYRETIDLDLDGETFAQRLENNDVQELSAFLSNYQTEDGLELVVALDRLKKRLAITERLVELGPAAAIRDKAILSKLQVLMEWATLAQEQDFASPDRTAGLAAYAKNNLNSGNTQIAGCAQAALTLAAIAEFLDRSPGKNRDTLADEALEQFQLAVEVNQNDPTTAQLLLEWLRILRTRTEVKEAARFFQSYEAFDSSSRQDVRELVVAARKHFVRTDFQIEDLMDSSRQNRDAAIARFVDQLNSILDSADVTESDLIYVLNRASDLFVFADAKAAQRIENKLDSKIESLASDQLKFELDQFRKRIELFAGSFDISGFVDAEGGEVGYLFKDAGHRVLFFAATETIEESIEELKAMLKSIGSLVADSRLELIFVYVDDGNDEKSRKEFESFARSSQNFHAWFLNTSTKTGSDAFSRLALARTPYTIVLDKQGQVLSLGASNYSVEEIVFKR